MLCPVCSVDLLMTDRQGIEIDYCPKCRGVWLDRGELDKLIERSTDQVKPFVGGREYDDDDRYTSRERDHREYPPKKKKNFLGDVFDIFD